MLHQIVTLNKDKKVDNLAVTKMNTKSLVIQVHTKSWLKMSYIFSGFKSA